MRNRRPDGVTQLAGGGTAARLSPGAWLREAVERHPDRDALVFAPAEGHEGRLTWAKLDRWSNQLARLLKERGVGADSLVAIALPNCAEHVAVAYAGWKLGACVLPLNHRMPEPERARMLALARPAALVSDWALPDALTRADLARGEEFPNEPLPDVTPQPGRAIATGGSTGEPRLIVDPRPFDRPRERSRDGLGTLTGMRTGQIQLISGPMFHNGPFLACHEGLSLHQTIVLMDRFDPARVLDLVERHRVSWLYLVPTMMRRLLDTPAISTADISSLEAVYHTAAPCPVDVKRAWIALVGPEHLYEGFGATEEVGLCAIRGDEWLLHPGSVGRPVDTEIRILDGDHRPCDAGEVGEIFMRRRSVRETFTYRGSDRAEVDADGFASVGDLGWLDPDGYLFLADRRVDLIITGGSNVYPAEVEAVIAIHPGVADVAVIGLPDPDWGSRVHAIVQPRSFASPPLADELAAHCRARLQPHKVPKHFEFVAELPRDEASKIRRSQLVAERRSDRESLHA